VADGRRRLSVKGGCPQPAVAGVRTARPVEGQGEGGTDRQSVTAAPPRRPAFSLTRDGPLRSPSALNSVTVNGLGIVTADGPAVDRRRRK
jgi:hypothetical protein